MSRRGATTTVHRGTTGELEIGARLAVGVHDREFLLCGDIEAADSDPPENGEELLVGRGTEEQASWRGR